VPIIAVGKLLHPRLVASVVERGIADLVALGRPILADPDFPRKLLENREKEIRKCIGCNYCYTRVASKNLAIRCTVNATRGREIEYRLPSSHGARRVVVVGGGPAGMEAARLFAGKGCSVLLFEREPELGGLLRLGGSIPRLYTRNLLHILEFQKWELSRLGVEVKLGMSVSPQQIQTMEADVLVLATGSRYYLPDIAGIDSAPVLRLDEYLKKPGPLGATVMVLGGREGAEISISLARQGKSVILVHDGQEETLGRAIYMKDPMREYYVQKYLREGPAEVLAKASISKLDGNSAWIRTVNGDEKSLHFDHLIVATDRFSQKELAGGFAGFHGKIHSIGDCVSPRSVTEAIYDAWFVAGRY
jgi:NADPH-dependent 2,4-dienoyl-CoA reductase/sulfur reductase-like enzyme